MYNYKNAVELTIKSGRGFSKYRGSHPWSGEVHQHARIVCRNITTHTRLATKVAILSQRFICVIPGSQSHAILTVFNWILNLSVVRSRLSCADR